MATVSTNTEFHHELTTNPYCGVTSQLTSEQRHKIAKSLLEKYPALASKWVLAREQVDFVIEAAKKMLEGQSNG